MTALLIEYLVPVVLSSPADAATVPRPICSSHPRPTPSQPGHGGGHDTDGRQHRDHALDVRITNQQVQLLDNGHTRFLDGPDPQFAGR